MLHGNNNAEGDLPTRLHTKADKAGLLLFEVRRAVRQLTWQDFRMVSWQGFRVALETANQGRT